MAVEAPADVVDRLVEAYWRVRSGLGFNKSAREFGAIPIDPYSHSPAHAGAQQPGMTGLVKEELLTRPLEVGLRVEDGEIVFDPILLRSEELISQPETWSVYGLDLQPVELAIPSASLGVTVCQVPVLVSASPAEPEIRVSLADGSAVQVSGMRLDRKNSASVFSRTGEITGIHASIPIRD